MKAHAVLLSGVALLLAGVFFIPWQKVDWGKIQLQPTQTITVIGQAKSQVKTQIATFTAGVNAVNDDKNTAINEVNQKIQTIIDAVKTFGISSDDIKTQNLNVYQSEERYYEEGSKKSRPGQWRVSNSIRITLRQIDRASELADLLSRSGATNVSGPELRVDETQPADKPLLEEAIRNAREKAEIMANTSGRQLGKIISLTEGTTTVPIYRGFEGLGFGGGGAPVEPGTSTIRKTVTIVFELE